MYAFGQVASTPTEIELNERIRRKGSRKRKPWQRCVGMRCTLGVACSGDEMLTEIKKGPHWDLGKTNF